MAAATLDERSPSAKKRPSASKSGAPRKKKDKEKRPPAEHEDEPVLSGRMVIALALALGMFVIPTSQLGRFITKTTPSSKTRTAWKIGETGQLHITIVTSDYDQLACADQRTVGEAHCEWQNEREHQSRKEGEPVDDNRRHVLQPYKTTDDALILMPGLWAQPELAMRLHTEPPRVGKSKLARFVVTCDVKFVDQWDQTKIRWAAGQKWDTVTQTIVGEPSNCKVAPPDSP